MSRVSVDEEFIHEELVRRAHRAISAIPKMWKKDRRIHSTILLWPADHVRTTTGERFSGVVFSELPSEEESGIQRKVYIERAVASCGAYAVLVTEQLEDCVRAIFESEHGTETWRLPIKNYGGTKVLGAAARRSNAEAVGVLWHAN